MWYNQRTRLTPGFELEAQLAAGTLWRRRGAAFNDFQLKVLGCSGMVGKDPTNESRHRRRRSQASVTERWNGRSATPIASSSEHGRREKCKYQHRQHLHEKNGFLQDVSSISSFYRSGRKSHSERGALPCGVHCRIPGYFPTVCIHHPPRSAMWNTYAFTRSGSSLSTVTGNEVFGSVLISPAFPPNKQTNKQTVCIDSASQTKS
jgi:hypothetical protein